MDNLIKQLGELERRANRLRDLMDNARDGMPVRAEGTDQTGSVHVEIGADALPTRFRVAPDWDRRIAPPAFGGAVVDACQVAVNPRLAGWIARLKEPQPGCPADAEMDSDRSASNVRPRSLSDLTEDLLRAFDDLAEAERHPAQPPPDARGVAGNGRLELVLSSAGLASCTSEPCWTATQTGAQLTMALAEALDNARAQLAARAPAPWQVDGLDGLLAEAMAVLGDPRRLAG